MIFSMRIVVIEIVISSNAGRLNVSESGHMSTLFHTSSARHVSVTFSRRRPLPKDRSAELRTLGRAPRTPGVEFWVTTSNWAPPNQTSLDAVVALLKTMIK